MLIKTKGAIPNTFMHALQDNLRLTNEVEKLRKNTNDESAVKKLIDENEQVKKLAKLKEEEIKNLTNEME